MDASKFVVLKKTLKYSCHISKRASLEKREKIKWPPSTMWTKTITWFYVIVDVHARPTPDIFLSSSCLILMRKSQDLSVSRR